MPYQNNLIYTIMQKGFFISHNSTFSPFFIIFAYFNIIIVMNSIQHERYKRHILLPEIGEEGQNRILNSSVLVIGTGGLGSPVAIYLTAAGVGTIGLVDPDKVDISNLQRQIIHSTPDIGKPKVESAAVKMKDLNPDVNIIKYDTYFDASNAADIISGFDIIIDATDNPESKFFINDICVENAKPLVHGAINQFSGNVMTILPGHANYRDLFPDKPRHTPPSSNYGVLGVIAGTIGIIQATEALKIITGTGDILTDKMLVYNALDMSFTKINITGNGN